MDLNELKLKMSSQLSDSEKDFIRQNSDKLNDEDKEAYADFLNVEPESNFETPENGSESGGEEPPAPVATPEPPVETPPASTGYQFKSEEEAQEFVRKEFERQKQAAVDAAKTPEEKKWVEDNWKPKNWNEGIKTAAEAAADIIEERQAARAKAIEDHNKAVEADWQNLRTEAKLPDIRNEDGTENPEGLKIHNAILDIGVKFGKKNWKDAYEVYKIVPVEHGGGYVSANGTPPSTSEAAAILAKSKTDAAKKAAAKLGGNNTGTEAGKGNSPLKPLTYEEMKSKSSAKILREAISG